MIRENRHQHSAAELSEQGEEQARYLAQRLEKLPLEAIITSPYERARQTSEIIAEVCTLPVVEESVFRERKRPSETEGKRREDPLVQSIEQQLHEHANEPYWRYSDEETFAEMCRRAHKALSLLEQREEERIAVVTHATFIQLLLLAMLFEEEKMENGWFQRFRKTFAVTNTGVTICEWEKESGWCLWTWSDYSHLV